MAASLALRSCWPWVPLCIALFGRTVAQSQISSKEVAPGLQQWLGRDDCYGPTWENFHAGFGDAIAEINKMNPQGALNMLARLVAPTVSDPFLAFECSTAVGAAMFVAARCCEQLGLPILSARFLQLMALFSSFDYQMKGEEYIDASVWPITWMEGMQAIVRSISFLKENEVSVEQWRASSLRTVIAVQPTVAPRRQLAIVSVCDYDASQTPLARLSQLNKERYARQHGYDVIMYDKAPWLSDPISSMFTEPASYRPPAWSKVDAVLETLAKGEHDWVLWLDCDSYFMDMDSRLEDVIGIAEAECSDSEGDARSVTELKALVAKWMEGPPAGEGSPQGILKWYDDLLSSEWKRAAEEDRCSRCTGDQDCGGATGVQRNRTLGWEDWLYAERRPQLIASEDGLMLNTGVVLARASVWTWTFFQKVRWMTFGRSPVTQHPWWEQTAMMYLLQLPFTLEHAMRSEEALTDLGPPGASRGQSRAVFMMPQKHINPYPPLVASALKTHYAFDAGDFIVSFSGCKTMASQELCNQLFLGYFAEVHGASELEADVTLRRWL